MKNRHRSRQSRKGGWPINTKYSRAAPVYQH
jgi:hypothetical protein